MLEGTGKGVNTGTALMFWFIEVFHHGSFFGVGAICRLAISHSLNGFVEFDS